MEQLNPIISLLMDLHKDGERQGPGSPQATLQALNLLGIDFHQDLTLGDFGCGTGASTLILAKALKGTIHAVDFLEPFLQVLEQRAADHNVAEKILTHLASIDDLPFHPEVFDIIWSEGAIYNIGFEKGISSWRQYLKPGGRLVVSEITWLTSERPQELTDFWHKEYPEIGTASEKIGCLERHGYKPLGYFVLPEECWLTNYYEPLEARYEGFLQRHASSTPAKELVKADMAEIALYRTYKNYYSYGMYIAQRMD